MLTRLMNGQALTASELAYVSGVSPQTASEHLAKLSDAGLLSLEKRRSCALEKEAAATPSPPPNLSL
jgi:DNA-binding transcriptional ArsR family regulator